MSPVSVPLGTRGLGTSPGLLHMPQGSLLFGTWHVVGGVDWPLAPNFMKISMCTPPTLILCSRSEHLSEASKGTHRGVPGSNRFLAQKIARQGWGSFCLAMGVSGCSQWRAVWLASEISGHYGLVP
jgi:hypothetical protein